jgi:polyisoprenoid-binding protein YceI
MKLLRPSSIVVGTIALTTMSFAVIAHAKLARTGSASVKFHADTNVPLLSVDGTSNQLTVGDDGTSLTVSVPLGTLSTGIGLRDTHMKNALEADKFPNAELTVARSAINFPAQGASASGTAQGTMKLHGQSKPISFGYTVKRDGSGYHVTTGSMTVNMNDFGIFVKKGSIIPATVKPNVGVQVSFDANE